MPTRSGSRELTFSEAFACVYCGLSFEELAPRLFSFNSPYGACPDCSGLGEKIEIDPWKVIPDRSKSIDAGAIVPWSKSLGSGRFPSMNPYYLQQLERVLRSYRVKTTTPIEKMPEDVLDIILYGTEHEQNFSYESRAGKVWEYRATFEGVVNNLQRRYSETSSDYVKEDIEKFMSASTCPKCKGARLKPEALAVTVGGENIDRVTRMSIERCEQLLPRIRRRRTRRADRATGAQRNSRAAGLSDQRRVELSHAGAFGRRRSRAANRSAFVWPRRSAVRWSACCTFWTSRRSACTSATTTGCWRRCSTLRDLGNTLIVVEHDEDTIRTADVVVDIGPGAGAEGGHILTRRHSRGRHRGTPIRATGAYISGRKFIPIPRRAGEAARLA